MKANELRIGNYVRNSLTELQVCQVFNDSFQGMFVGGKGCYSTEFTEGIPLTEEWLLKFGFESVGVNWEIRSFSIWYSRYQGAFNVRYYFIGSANEKVISLLYVHQLQNLYFALTGEELSNH